MQFKGLLCKVFIYAVESTMDPNNKFTTVYIVSRY